MLANWRESIDQTEEKDFSNELNELVLPSNEEWCYHVYYRLVDLQREIDSNRADKRKMEIDLYGDVENKIALKVHEARELSLLSKINEWEPIIPGNKCEMKPQISKSHSDIRNLINLSNSSMINGCGEPGWRLSDILLAAKVLQNNNISIKKLSYSDEAEMRRVYGLVYDVLRYKKILDRALENADFWTSHNEFRDRKRIVWLLLYDMQSRKFTNHAQLVMMQMRRKAFETVRLNEIEQALLNFRTKIAASLSRLRIGGSALTLEQLLPPLLQNEGMFWSNNNAVASGWVNTIKIPTKNEFINRMSSLGLILTLNFRKLDEKNYAFDPICPKFIVLHEKSREELARSDLVREYGFIFLDRSLCLGAATLARAIQGANLCGPVILTHSMAPRHTAYLAGLLADIDEAGRLLAFDAGPHHIEYETYLENLGIGEKLCRIFSENYSQVSGFAEIERATIVLATPPCSYTGLKDIVDLAVARGGDVKLLESLTSIDDENQLKYLHDLLVEKISSLKYALTRPNVQLLIYEAHSVLSSETIEMLDQLIDYANKMAADKYTRKSLPRQRNPQKDSSQKIQSSKPSGYQRTPTLQDSQTKNPNEYDDDCTNTILSSHQIVVPDSDLFEVGNIFDFHDKESKTTDPIRNNGCYLAVIRRKEMMQFNSLFMIKVAELKGLFGNTNSTLRQGSQQSKDEISMMAKLTTKERDPLKLNRDENKKKLISNNIPTLRYSSLLKTGSRVNSRQSIHNGSSKVISVSSVRPSCLRYDDHIERDDRSINEQVCETRRQDARSWWEQSANYLIHAARCESCKFRIFHTDPWTKRVLYPSKVQQILFANEIY